MSLDDVFSSSKFRIRHPTVEAKVLTVSGISASHDISQHTSLTDVWWTDQSTVLDWAGISGVRLVGAKGSIDSGHWVAFGIKQT